MTTPSQEAFQSWINQFQQFVEENRAFALESANKTLNSSQEMVSCLDNFDALIKKNWQQMAAKAASHPVTAWLTSQSGYQSAERLLQKKLSRTLNTEPTRKRFALNEGYPLALHKLQKIADQTPAVTWSGSIIVALDEYLHTDADAKFHAKKQAWKDVHKAMQMLEGASQKLLDKRLEHVVRVKIRSLYFWLERTPETIERDQKNKSERQFVKTIARVNLQYGSRTPKPDVITELMELDCIRIKLDQRTIARICAEMTNSRKKTPEIVMSN